MNLTVWCIGNFGLPKNHKFGPDLSGQEKMEIKMKKIEKGDSKIVNIMENKKVMKWVLALGLGLQLV